MRCLDSGASNTSGVRCAGPWLAGWVVGRMPGCGGCIMAGPSSTCWGRPKAIMPRSPAGTQCSLSQPSYLGVGSGSLLCQRHGAYWVGTFTIGGEMTGLSVGENRQSLCAHTLLASTHATALVMAGDFCRLLLSADLVMLCTVVQSRPTACCHHFSWVGCAVESKHVAIANCALVGGRAAWCSGWCSSTVRPPGCAHAAL